MRNKSLRLVTVHAFVLPAGVPLRMVRDSVLRTGRLWWLASAILFGTQNFT
uniref:Uncharacterized protein n=1 Tax=Arundo donax TaxID=35708 RepID=A0A0A8ZR69_ARUDO